MNSLEDIVNECKKGSRQAGEELYKLFSGKMFAICLRYSRNRAEAEDNFQDGFIKVLESIGQYSGKGAFEGWMKRIFINISLEKYRKKSPLQLVEEYSDMEQQDIDDDIIIPEDKLMEFVSELPERYKLVFNLYAIEDMPHKEIAALTGITEGTSKSNLARAREILKRKVKEYIKNE